MFFMGTSILIKYQTIKAEHKTVVPVTREPLIFTIDNMPENAIVSASGTAGFSPQPADLAPTRRKFDAPSSH